jgi:predicted AlkP superfamily phosphohydrolase/phosphomutase
MGLGRIWINQAGREPKGIVSQADSAALLSEIQTKLMGLTYEGENVLNSVALASELYGKDRVAPHESSDLILGFRRGFRVSWNSCLGGISEPVFAKNLLPWSGDHCSVDPTLVPGVCISSVKLKTEGTVLDIHPTIRDLLGLRKRDDLPGRSLRLP